jgi:mono/diheme cytochrome c family protein
MLSRYKFISVIRNSSPRRRVAAPPRLLFILGILVFSVGCRYDMQDQPRYKAYKKSDFFPDGRASRELPDGTVPRGFLRADKALYTGKKEGAAVTANVPAPTIDASGATIASSFPNDVEEFPVPVTKELIDRGQQRYNIYCVVCHGPTGSADGMIVRRGFPKPPTYHDDRLRNAPVGHFFDVITNGWGKMNGYASQVPVADRWAIIAYIRALQLSQNPHGMKPIPMAPKTQGSPVPANPNTAGGIRN